VLLYELLAGQKPFTGESPTTVVYQIMHVEPPPVSASVPELPESLQEIVGRALQKNPDERYSRASEMSADLQMVKMMLDLPLKTGEGDTGPLQTIGPLHASTLGSKGSSASIAVTSMLDAPMRASAAARAADAAPGGAGAKAGSGMIIGIAAGVVLIGGAIAWFATHSGGASGPGSTTATSATSTAGGSRAGAPAGTGEFFVTSLPAGAKIRLNGSDTGQVTPSLVSFAGKSSRSIELSLKGFAPITASVSEADLKIGSKEYKFDREAGPVRLTLNGSYPFEVLQGTKVIDGPSNHHELTVQPGAGAVVVRNAEMMLSSTIPVDYQRSSMDATVPASGTLAVFASLETCKVSVDGQDLGFPPIAPKRIASGSHSVALKCPDDNKKDETRRITVTAGERMDVKFIGSGGQQ
jgi:hypothetical protein